MATTLGLDLGPNSIGWALIEDNADGTGRLIDAGVRVFPEGVDNFDTSKEVSRNEDRRIARGMRRQILRRKRRRRILRDALIEVGLFPSDRAAQQRLFDLDPYDLRRRSLNEKLNPHEIGRVLLHLNQRRGFLSNRKKDRGDKEVKGMLAEISQLAGEMGDRTLGEHLAGLRIDPHHRIRGRHTHRAMLAHEFDRIWQAQANHHPELLTDIVRYGRRGAFDPLKPLRPRRLPHGSKWLIDHGIQGIIFFQRPMFWPKSMVGVCELEKGEKRCPKADRAAQRFRLLQEINNLRYIDPELQQEATLSSEQRMLLLEKLGVREKATFDDLRKWLGFLENVRFNLERGERSQIGGNKTDHLISKAIGKAWHKRPEQQKDEIVRLICNSDYDDAAIAQRLIDEFDLEADQANALLGVDLPAGYMSVSLKAINKLLPHLQRGLRYMAESDPEASALHAAGYLRRDELQRRLFDKLPSLHFIRTGPLADLPNPIVKATLYELRKVVNAIIREYGKPDEIHVEMARELKMSDAKRREVNSTMRKREQERADAAEFLRQNGARVTREAITRLLLWRQQGEHCIYSGRPISFQQLFGGEIDVDHILPYSRTLDDSQNNKVVCFRSVNHDKGQRSPFEWLGEADPDRYEQLCQRARALPYPKYRKFLQKELELDDFIQRQLRDTAYIARLAIEYLRMLVGEHQVIGTKGGLTAELRHQWGVGTILSELPDSPAWQEQSSLLPGEKNRADHRHHAIDAVVVALTNRSRLQKLSRIRDQGGTQATGEILPEPWPRFRDDVATRIRTMNVSHRARRKVSGRLHEETNYGPVRGNNGKPVEGVFVVRKPVDALSPNEVESIRDPVIRRIVADAFAAAGQATGRKKRGASQSSGNDNTSLKERLANLKMPSGVAIRRVRVLRNEKTIQPIRKGTPGEVFVKPGRTHHLCLFEWQENGKTRRDAVFVTMIEAARRARDGEPIIQRRHPHRPDAKFLMSFSAGEMLLADWKGEQKLLTFKTAASTQGQIYFADNTDARKSAAYKQFVCNCNTLKGRKVTVDPLGRIRWAND